MSDNHDGPGIARERIAEEARARTGFLDLGMLGLEELPAELFALAHLRRLNLGNGLYDLLEGWLPARSGIAPNRLDAGLARLAMLSDLVALSVGGTALTTLAGIPWLGALRSFLCSGTQVSDLTPLAEFGGLQLVGCSQTEVSDLGPLARLTALTILNCRKTRVSDLGPLVELSALQFLGCSQTQITDLGPLSGLTALRELRCWDTRVRDLAPLAKLRALRSLECSGTQVADLAPLAGLSALQSLGCWRTRVSDLTPLAGLSGLRSLICPSTRVSDLTPLVGLSALQSIDCSNTQVGDLTPLAGLSALRSLRCSGTRVSDLTPLAELSALEVVDLSLCSLTKIPSGFWQKSSLDQLHLFETRVPGIPTEVLSQQRYESCLESLRAHLSDLDSGKVAVPDVKLMVLGNGRVGKTQICRRLHGQDYDARVPSTHGVIVTSAPIPASGGAEPAVLHIWDFGGQDIYHGTHALFMRTRAAFLIVWIPEAESSGEHVWDGMTFRNHPLPYWIDTVRHFGAAGSPVLIVQARCDRLEDDVHRLPAPPELLAAFPHWELQYSAFNNRKRAALDEALREAVERVRGLEGEITTGAGRLNVKRRLEQLRDADAAVPPDQRQYRTVTQEHFRRLCEEAGGISSPEYLLSYLANAGIVFYRPGLFDDRIILDQAWALEAIYAVFNRETCYRPLRHLRGRFTGAILEGLVWREYTVAEQEVFLGMMQSCGICFVHRRGIGDANLDDEYIAPDLLPERPEIQTELDAIWDEETPVERSEFEYAVLHPGMVCSVISRIGIEAGVTALYWRGGLCVYETTTRSRALIEQEMADEWRGKILVRTQRGQAGELLRRLSALVRDESARLGVQLVNASPADPSSPPSELSAAGDERTGTEATLRLQFSQERGGEAQYFVSYAWGDETPEGKEREAIVDQLCEAAEQRGLVILRDKRVLRVGDSISKFMQRLAGGDRIFVILSDRYLHSPYCMYELMEMWRKCSAEEENFLTRVRLYVIPGTKIFSLSDRAQYAVHWKQEYEKVHQLIHDHGAEVVGQRGFREYKLMGDFRRWVAEILETVADRLQPRDFEDLARYGLDDLVPGG
jgi:internalin A